jgi:rubrerythrin
MASLLDSRGTPLERQQFTWRDMVQNPISKLDDDAFTRVRVILMNGIEMEALRFQHSFARMCPDPELRLELARVRRKEMHQQVAVNWLIGADHSPLETTIGYEQVAIEVTAAISQAEPDAYLRQVYDFGLLEDFDHMYRYSALMDRLEGKDANNILQSYTDVLPGRPTVDEHRDPADDLRTHYDRTKASFISKMHALTLVAGEQQTQNYYQNIGPTIADAVGRQLYAEIAHIEEQHVTQYESMVDPNETWLEKWLLHEANEVYNYRSCAESETNPRLRAMWERCADYELGHLAHVAELFKKHEKRDPAEVLGDLPKLIDYSSHRDYVRKVLAQQVDLRADGARFVPKAQEPKRSIEYRRQLNSAGSPSETVAAGYRYSPGTELARKAA